ncbi:MAG: protoheme IX farnesyltransferase [Deltaproteobacteria bacterium]|nr:protoheme IX farnesyltransferase [Deltaproteobacteria bacterium]
MAHPTATTKAQPVALGDLVALTKPKITRLVVFTGAVGMWLAPVGTLTPVKVIFTLLGTVLVVAAANALNMYLERDVDALMTRTADRPLPAGRLPASVGLGFGLGLALFSLPILSQAVNPTTALLGFLALVIYVGAYTPLKQKTWLAVIVGAVPGAIPPLMGWTAATGHLGAPGVALFAIMFLWQIPHTLAITLFRDAEYRRAGFQTLPVQRGETVARWQTLAWSPLLVASTLAPWWLGLVGLAYLATACVLGIGWMVLAVRVARERGAVKWARGLFIYSIIYLTLLFGVLLATAGHAKA